MQTFLPDPGFDESARLLDDARLGKQRVETLQVLRALELPDYGWVNHPAVRMWRGRTPALVAYGLAMVRQWRDRGHADGTAPAIAEFAPGVVDVPQQELAAAGLLPSWLGDAELHRSHRSNLLAKDPDHYRPLLTARYGPEPDDLPYVWPGPDDVPVPPGPAGTRVWVVRPPTETEVGVCLVAGVMGLGTRSGVDVPAADLGPEELRALSRERTGRRPAKDLRQLSTLLDEVRPGDLVGLPVQDGAGLLLGEVAGDYVFVPHGPLPHRRPVRWGHVVPRSAARRPATLQDPRALFAVVLDPAAARPGTGSP
ncbi:MSMEG_6728 family protein [uncultured Ornithinimicrobium sp.]|uniref:MSMEG_6728 family protein n=1 Tax=uncultured Ornithinimicrobium sp. TaxID=259307 RepID=UPI002593B50B|nr:MSMEG_6728 family protein [uncultured Ornithinimicrobium sp.]